MNRYLKLSLIIGLCALAMACHRPTMTTIRGNTMGTTFSVKIIDEVDGPRLEKQIDRRLKEVNQLMSTYIHDSELSRFNQLAVGESIDLSPENLQMLALAKKLHRLSGGKFDVTVGPLVNLWNFGPDPTAERIPPEAAIKEAMSQVGTDHLHLDGKTLTKTKQTYVDFSSIAKGYGVDELARLVEESGASNYLVEIGGELRAKGHNLENEIWQVGIEKPDASQRIPFSVIPLANTAMATSGDYRNYFEVNGKRYSHTIDPSTGYPITNRLASVTVLADTTALADGMATAIDVMGAEAGLKMANEQHVAAFVILKTDAGFEGRYSAEFERYLAANPN